MEIYEITGFRTGISQEGVNYLQPSDSFQNIQNGFVYRQVLQSRQGISRFAPRLAGETRVFGIFEHTLPDSTKQLLVFDQNFAYLYNTVTGVFDQLAFGGSMAAYAGFNITAKDFYISGTSYPDKDNNARFVFTGEGITPNAFGSAIFYFDGTDIKDFTNPADNADYADPPQGQLVRANYVIWFNERLNFIVPEIQGITYQQGVLYSGIRDSSGNGDKFNVPGSGLIQADTYQYITGATILGQVLALNFNRTAFVAEKTRDAFNPYFIRQIPSVEGTDAKFSAVSWNDIVDSLGKTGILGLDGRRSLRIDTKIPRFTQDEIDQIGFNLTYGGFDRINNQFLWSYKLYESDSDTQNSVLVRNYEESTWATYDLRLSVFGQTDLGLNLTWDDIDETINPSWAMWDTTEEIWDRIGLGEAVQKTLAGDDLGFIYDLNVDFDDYYTDISAVATGATTTLTVDDSAFVAGDLVTIENVQGMTELNNFDDSTTTTDYIPYVVLSATPTSIEINVDSTTYSAYTPNTGSISKVISFSAETIPFNPYRSIGRRCFVSYVEFLIDNNGGNLKVDIFADEEESPFKQDILLLPSSTSTKARQWITIGVDNEAEFHTFRLKQMSPASQVKITSIRIHCEPGGLTSG